MVHGQQELALFNTHAGGHCFQPIHIFEAGSGKPILSLLRPGKRPSGEEIARVLAHVIHRIRRRWLQVAILVRGDGHYCAPEVLDLLREKRCDYILGLSRNKTLDALAEPWREQCRWHWKPGPRVRRFHQFQYAAQRLSTSMEALAALGAELRLRRHGFFAAPRVRQLLQEVVQSIDQKMLDDVTADQEATALAIIASMFRHAMDLLDNPARMPGWAYSDPVLLQGMGSQVQALCPPH